MNCHSRPYRYYIAFRLTTRSWIGAFEVKQCKYETDALNNSKAFSGTLLGNACFLVSSQPFFNRQLVFHFYRNRTQQNTFFLDQVLKLLAFKRKMFTCNFTVNSV
jgi:hypothetical protein